MNSDIIFSIVVVLAVTTLIVLYLKTFVFGGGTPALKEASYNTVGSLVQRLNESNASRKKGILP